MWATVEGDILAIPGYYKSHGYLMLYIVPPHLQIRRIAALSVYRLRLWNNFVILNGLRIEMRSLEMPTNVMPITLNFKQTFGVLLPTHEDWGIRKPNFERGSLVWYTDGSQMRQGLEVWVNALDICVLGKFQELIARFL